MFITILLLWNATKLKRLITDHNTVYFKGRNGYSHVAHIVSVFIPIYRCIVILINIVILIPCILITFKDSKLVFKMIFGP